MVIHTYTDDGSVLSVDAAPFHPRGYWDEFMIYNDGEPSMTVTTEKDRFDILHGINDEAIDEFFPPDAEEAFELESAEAFVMEMAILAMLEEREERARRTYCHLEKRWEVRRAAGPSGRTQRTFHLIIPKNHSVKNCSSKSSSLSIRKVGHRSMSGYDRENTFGKSLLVQSSRSKTAAYPQRPIIQPRKKS